MFLRLKHLQDFANKLAIKLKASFITKQEGIDGIILEQDWQLVDTITADSSITLPSLDTIEDIYIEMYTTDGTIIHQSSIKKDSLLFTSTNTSYREILLDSILDAQTYVTYYLDTNTIKAGCCEGTDVTSESTSVTTKVYIRKINETTGNISANRITYGDNTVAASLDNISTSIESNSSEIINIKNNVSNITGGPSAVVNGTSYDIDTINVKCEQPLESLSYPLYDTRGSGAVVLNDEIYVVGSTGDINCFDSHSKYNPSTNTWTSLSTLPLPYSDRPVVLNGEMHILGGNGNYTNHYKYDISTDTWSSVSTLPYYFHEGASVVLNNEIHILGSSYYDNSGSLYSKFHYKYNPSTNTWTSVSTLPYYFSDGGAVVLDNEIHILGSGVSDCKTNHYKYNTSTDTWSSVSTLPYTFRAGASVVLNNEIHILGNTGGEHDDDYKYHYKYNTSTNTWTIVDTLDRYSAYCKYNTVVYNNELYMMSGEPSTNPIHAYKNDYTTMAVDSININGIETPLKPMNKEDYVDKTTYNSHVEEFNTVKDRVSVLNTNVETNTKDITTLKNNISGMSSGPIGVLSGVNYNINKINLDCNITWSSVSTLPYVFYGGSAIVLNNEIHILGSNDNYNKYHYKYNTSSNTWSSVSTIPYNFYLGSAIVLNNEIHILGSSSGNTKHYKYSTSTNTWSSVSTLPYEFFSGSAIVLDNEIHILGGSGNFTKHYKYNTSTNTWSSVSTLPYVFTSGSAVLLNNEIHILGCSNDNYNKYHYKYNTFNNTWSSVSTLPYDFYRGSAVVLDNEMHILGGGNGNYTNHYKYNTSTNTWSSVNTLPYGNYLGSAIVLDNEIHILGGTNSTNGIYHYKYAKDLSTGSIKSVELTDGTNTFTLIMKTS